jgi:hypothetical protein
MRKVLSGPSLVDSPPCSVIRRYKPRGAQIREFRCPCLRATLLTPFMVCFAPLSSEAFWMSLVRDIPHNLLRTKVLQEYRYNIILGG